MAGRSILTVTSPLGYRVKLTRNRWRQIIGFKHPALAGHESLVRKCLADPEVVRESVKDPNVHLYYAAMNRVFVCVVVTLIDRGTGFVVTVSFTNEIKKGRKLWTK